VKLTVSQKTKHGWLIDFCGDAMSFSCWFLNSGGLICDAIAKFTEKAKHIALS
jgi:hypothetical protein